MTADFETLYRLVFFGGVLALLALERVAALQRSPVRVARRWTANIGLLLLGSAVSTLVLPIGVYAFAAQQPPGPMARLGLPLGAQVVITFLLLDLWKYWEHRLFHGVPLLWRCHLVHHSDTDVDVTTSERHHPLEVVPSVATLVALVWMLGLPAAGLGLYLLVATAVALYSHANLRLPAWLEAPLCRIVVTAPVHAVHHSALQAHTDANYGAVLTLWDRWFGTFVDPAHARIAHFGLGYFHRRADTRWWRVLQQPFLFRGDLAYPARDDEADATTAPAARAPFVSTPEGRAALIAGAAGLVLVLAAMWPTIVEMAAVWRSNEAYQYAWLVVPMVVYVLVWHDDAARRLDPRPGYAGVAVAIGAALCWGAAALMNIDVGRQLGLVLALQGVALATLGWRTYRKLLPALALLFLAIPSGDLLQPALRLLTLKSIEFVAWAASLPHRVDGFVVLIGSRRYIVVDECAGMTYVTLAAFLGYCFGLLLYPRSFARVLAMASFGAVLGILSNLIRVNAIVLIDWMRGSQMDLTAHGSVQWAMLLATLGVLFFVLSRAKGGDAAAPPASDRSPAPVAFHRFAPVIAGACALSIVAGVAALQARDTTVPAVQAVALPQMLGSWMLADPRATWTVDPPGKLRSLRATYSRDGRDIEVVVMEGLSANAKLLPSRLAPGERSVWREKWIGRDVGCAGSDCMGLVHVVWQRDHSEALRHAYFTYGVGPFVTDSRFAARALHGWHRLIGSNEHPTLTGFTSDAPLPADEVAAALRGLRSALREAAASSVGGGHPD